MTKSVRTFETSQKWADAAAEHFDQLAHQAVLQRGRFSIALAGGSTPRRLYERLAEPPYRDQIDWSRMDFFWSDERAVPPDSEHSNYFLAYEAWLWKVPVAAHRVYRMPGEADDVENAAARYQQQIATVLGHPASGPPPQFDLILLGLGEDGHTASLFPHSDVLAEPVRWVAVSQSPRPPAIRLTMTYPILNAARNVMFLVTGKGKADIMAQVLEGPHDPQRLPAQAVRPSGGELSWFVDRAAASKLTMM